MEVEGENVGLSPLVAPAEIDQPVDLRASSEYYPFAIVLRLRVLQIVFGITCLVMGTVAFIEEQGELNLSLGIPAGASTILAAAASIHTTRGFGGYRASTCMPGSSLRFLGPSVKIAIPLSILWAMAFSFLTALAVQSTKTLTHPPTYLPEGFASDYVYNTTSTNPTDLVILASVELSLAIVTLVVIAILLRIDCKYDPD
ncbi:uncharacterized protein [Atheta coriaria]|uniref:uncharacterized protein n=1 Tax=Dalotia coriaria TaxID=877792 RepID=UPI0031F456AC